MLKEEWRTHSRLFGSYGFAAFPLIIILMTGISYPVLFLSGFTLHDILTGMHALVFFFGLNVGTIGFISRDAIKNLLGEQNLLIFSSRTLPISKKRILATFLIKDLIYYAAMFITPIILGFIPAFYYFHTSVATLLLVWVSATGLFMLGVAASFLLSVLYLRSRMLAGTIGIVAVAATLVFTDALIQATPLAFFNAPSIITAFTGFLPIIVLAALGLALHTPAQQRRVRTASTLYRTLRRRLPVTDSPITATSLLYVIRSSGSLFKIWFSQGIVFAVFTYFLLHIPFMTTVLSRGVIAMATILGLGSITTYSWLNRFDRGENYLKLPLTMENILRGKLYAYFMLVLPTGYTYLVAAGILFGFKDALIAFIVFPFLCMYMFGITAYLTGLDPDRMLFDAKRFGAFSILSGVVLVPTFLALLIVQDPTILTVFLILLAAVAAGAGHTFYEHAANQR